MAQPRKYASQADRQAAYRTRQSQQQGRLMGCLYRLEAAVWDAADRGDALARQCTGTSPEAILIRLAEAFEQRGAPNT